MNDQPIARFEDVGFDINSPYVQIDSSVDFGVVVLTARTLGDDDQPGVVAPVVMNRREFARLIGDVLVNADTALKADIEIAAAFAEGEKRRG